jgi:hypothetical protein
VLSVLARCVVASVLLVPFAAAQAADPPFATLFPVDGPVGSGWIVGHWSDVSNPPPKESVTWVVKDGNLWGGKSKSGRWVGTWLMSEKEYGDFILEVAFKFMKGGAKGNGGIALRAGLKGDPAYTGLEMQITDPRYETRLYPAATGEQLTGALYLVHPPRVQMYLSGDWNEYRIEMRGSKVKATLNGVVIQDVDLDTLTKPAKQHGKEQELIDATPGAQRPRRGHIGFQDLSEDGEQLVFRKPRIAALN